LTGAGLLQEVSGHPEGLLLVSAPLAVEHLAHTQLQLIRSAFAHVETPRFEIGEFLTPVVV